MGMEQCRNARCDDAIQIGLRAQGCDVCYHSVARDARIGSDATTAWHFFA